VPDQIRQWMPGRYVTLGTDGYGRSDGRQALREHFEVDRHHVAVAALKALADDGQLEGIRRAGEALEALARELDADFVLGDFEKAIRESQEGSERIRHIVRDLRDFSRADGEEQVPADVNQCLDSTANIVYTMMKHTVVLEKDYAELPKIEAYPMQLKQVFMNLLVNAYQAIEATPDRAQPGLIRIETRAADEGVVVRISDSGVGIEKQHIDRIFDPFFTTKEPGEGTGLGLSLSYAIVERHGGRMRVESELGFGTTFELWLPWEASVQAGVDDG